MNRTVNLFEERKQEIEFYYSILKDLDSSSGRINTIDNARFERILKSNFILMLYNIIEACVTSGFVEIYEAIENHGNTYKDVIAKFQRIWSDYKVSEPSESTANQGTYKKVVRSILDDVLSNKPLDFDTANRITFNKSILGISGNLDARVIKSLLKEHNILFNDQADKQRIYIVRQKRNGLAHGEESFGDCPREYTVSDLEEFKDEVLGFIEAVIESMKEYYTFKRYLASTV